MRISSRRPPLLTSLLTLALLALAVPPAHAKDVTPLAINAPAPELDLPGVDDKTYRLADFADAQLLVVIFTCNHCPTAQAYEERIAQLYDDYHERGVAFVAISPNDPLAVRLDELGYTDLGDTLAEMKIQAKRRGYKFPYLYDGETQRVSTAFGVLATPHVFIFDKDRRLQYNGRIDDGEITPPTSHDAKSAIEALLASRPVATPTTRVFGCSTKWADKRADAKASIAKWNAEPIELKTIDAEALRQLAANDTENFRLINVWSTSCPPCIAELPDYVTINRMYRGRHFELITLTTDPPELHEAAHKVLEKSRVAAANYIFHTADKDALAEALDPQWQGPVPYTILIAPGGEIVKRWKEETDPRDLKSEISTRHGKTYASRK
jgi:peroxiredoxin